MDIKKSVNRFLNHWKPDIVIFAESELWPNFMKELNKRNVPQILVNARMSDKSNDKWNKRPKLAKEIFGQLTQVIAQSEVDGDRFRKLGAPWVSVAGNLKFDVEIPKGDEVELAELKKQIGDRPVWIAVSTHPREEAAVARVHKMLKEHVPELLSVIVPRHATRSAEIYKELKSTKLNLVRRSDGQEITENTDIFIGDTMGEMGLYLRLGKIAFLGKSLKEEGGQNPIEPAMIGTAILSGKYVQNFREIYQTLIDNGGARLVKDEETLAEHVLHLLKNEKDLDSMCLAAKVSVGEMKGALKRTCEIIDQYIMPLRVKASLNNDVERNSQNEGNIMADKHPNML